MVFNALQITSYVFSKEVGANAKKKSVRSTKDQFNATHWHLRSVNSASITSLAIQWRRVGAGMRMTRLASAVPQLQHERGGAYRQTKAFQTSGLSPNSHLFPNKTTTCGSVYRAKSVNGEGDASGRPPVNVLKESSADEETCGDRYRIEHAGRWLDQRVAILADQPLCSDELDEQLSSLLCQ